MVPSRAAPVQEQPLVDRQIYRQTTLASVPGGRVSGFYYVSQELR